MSFVKIFIHAVWSTKKRQPFLIPEKLQEMCQHILTNAHDKGIFIDSINGHLDHIHVLMLAKNNLSIAEQIQLLKGESAHWANKNAFLPEHFSWARKYYAASVSGLKVPTVREYIQSQQEHHKAVTFTEEYKKFIVSLGYLWPKDENEMFE